MTVLKVLPLALPLFCHFLSAFQVLATCRHEAAEASAALRTFLSSGELHAERQRHLQAVVGWKTSAAAGALGVTSDALSVVSGAKCHRAARGRCLWPDFEQDAADIEAD